VAARIRSEAPKVYTRKLAELIFAQPYCRIANVVEAGSAQRPRIRQRVSPRPPSVSRGTSATSSNAP